MIYVYRFSSIFPLVNPWRDPPWPESHHCKSKDINKATWNNLIHGGCQSRAVFHNNAFPPSAHVTYQSHDMRGIPVNKTLTGQAGRWERSVSRFVGFGGLVDVICDMYILYSYIHIYSWTTACRRPWCFVHIGGVGWGGACINVLLNLRRADMLLCGYCHAYVMLGDNKFSGTFHSYVMLCYCKFSWTFHSKYVRWKEIFKNIKNGSFVKAKCLFLNICTIIRG